MNIKQAIKCAINCFENVKQGIEDNKLTDDDIIEFFYTYKDDMVIMIEQKIKEAKDLKNATS